MNKNLHTFFVTIVFIISSTALSFMYEDFESYQDSEQLNLSASLYLPDNYGFGRAVATLETDNPFDGQKCVRFYRSGYPNYTQFGFNYSSLTGGKLDMSSYSMLKIRYRGNPNHAEGYNLELAIKDVYANDIISKILIPDGAQSQQWQTIEVPITNNPSWANVRYVIFTDRKDNYGITDIYVDSVELVQADIYIIADSNLAASEDDPQGFSYQINLIGSVQDDVVVAVNAPEGVLVSSGGEFLPQIDVVFDPESANSSIDINVKAIDDEKLGYDRHCQITHTAQSSDPAFDGISMSDVEFLRIDNDYPVSKKPMKIVLLAGQSNMQGAGYNSQLESPYNQLNEDVSIYFDGRWQYLKPGMGASETRFGPEIAFGTKFSQYLGNDNLALIKLAVGGTSLDYYWKAPDENGENAGPLFTEFTEVIADALSSCNDYEIVGMLWQQGESDAHSDIERANAYEQNLRNFIKAIRSITNKPSLPFIIGQISDSEIWVQRAIVRAAQQMVADTIAYVSLVVSEGLTILSDQMHYDTAGTLELGTRFNDVLVDTIESKSDWKKPVITYGNISQGKFYKFSASTHSSYQDIYPCLDYSDGSILTDEQNDQWVGWFNQPVDIVLDLGKPYDIDSVRLNAKSQTNASIYYPASMQVYIRENDSQSWQQFGGQVNSSGNTSEHSQSWFSVEDAKTAARYVKYSLTGGGGNILVSEIEVYGDILNQMTHAPDIGFYNGAFPVTYHGYLNINRHETITEQRLSMVLWYHELNPAYSGSGFESIASLWGNVNGLGRAQANHRYLTIGWLPKYSTAAEIATGQDGYDEHFRQWFEKSIDYNLRGGNTDPIWLRPMNEMNGTWAFPGNTSSPISQWGGDPIGFRRAWRRIYNIAEQVGAADKHIFLWSPNGITYPAQEWNMPDKYYPGDNYVDWVGLSLYVQGQEGKKYPNNILTGDSGDGSFDFISNWQHKPLMIAEGCWRATSEDTDGVRWINEWFDMTHNFPRMKAAVWFHFEQNPNDPEDEGRSDMLLYPEEVLNTFKQRVAQRYYIKDPLGGWLDHNRDGLIDFTDFLVLADNWLDWRGQTQCFTSNEGVFVAEAENADTAIEGRDNFQGSWVSVEDAAAVGGWYMRAQSANSASVQISDLPNAPRLSFNLWFANAGEYYMHFRAGGSDTSQTGFWYAVDDESPQLYSFTPFSTTILRWYNTGQSVTINKPGLYSFDVWMARQGVKLDRIMLTDNPQLSLPSEPAESNRFGSPINPADINEDYIIDLNDFSIMSEKLE